MSDHAENRTLPALFQVVLALDLFPVHYGDKEIGKEEHQSPMEPGRRHAHDGKGTPIHLDNAANHAGIIVKMAMPIGVGEHDVGSAVRTVLVDGVEQTAKIGR